MHVRELLAECASKIIDHGPDSPEVQVFIDQHRDDAEFVECAELARSLKRAICSEKVSDPADDYDEDEDEEEFTGDDGSPDKS